MRILFWAESFWPTIGGIETWAARFVTSLRERGIDVTVVTTHTGLDVPDQDDFRGIPVHRFPLWQALKSEDPGKILRARQAVAKLRSNLRPDCVHVNTCGAATAFYLWTRHVAPAPTLFTMHGAWTDSYTRPGSLLARALEASDCVAAVSTATRDWLMGFVAHLGPRIRVIYPAIDPLPETAPTTEPTLLCMGRLSREKGFDLAIQAFARIRGRFSGARLLIAGDGDEKESLARLAAQLGVADAVEFTGWVSPRDVPALIGRARIVVVPSRMEGFGLAALEAAHAGRPVAGFAVGGLPEVVADGSTGLLAPPEDVETLAGHLARLLENPGLAQRLGDAARDRAQAAFSWQVHMDNYTHALNELRATGDGGA